MIREAETKPSREKGAITAPFTVQVDTREQKPYSFSYLKSDLKSGGRLISVPRHFEWMENGDYSIKGFSDRLAIERKSMSDLFASVKRRANFEGRLARMTEIRERLGFRNSYFAVVVEAELSECRTNPPRYNKLPFKSLNRTIIAWRQRYSAVDWWFVESRAHAEAYTFRLLERFWKDHSED